MPRAKQPAALFLGEGDAPGAGDSYLVTDFLPEDLAQVAFENLKTEVKWQTMQHRGGEVPRLVAVEGEIQADGSYPVYRHPADNSPPLLQFSPTVSLIREHVQKALKHPVNHVLIQLYRTGADYISDHSDKTIDVVRGSNIVNVSLGAQRTLILRLKRDKAKEVVDSETVSESHATSDVRSEFVSPRRPGTPRQAQRIPLPHNSMFVMGLETNAKWLHGINRDNRPIKSPDELAEGGARISLTFRHIDTFMTKDGTRIWGQGARSKSQEKANLISTDQAEIEALIRAFGEENQRSDFDWQLVYGNGFDVHLA